MSRAESHWVLVIRAQHLECARWDGAVRGQPALYQCLPMTLDAGDDPPGVEPPQAAMQRAVAEFAQGVAAAAAGEAREGGRLQVLVADRWTALATVPWSNALVRTGQREQGVREQLHTAGFDIGPADLLRLDDASPFGRPRLAVAYPAALVEALRAAAALLRVQLVAVLPLEVTATRFAKSTSGRAGRAFALLDGTRVRFMTAAAGGITAGQSVTEPGLAAEASALLPMLWRRQRLRDPGLSDDETLHVLELAPASGPRRHSPNGSDAKNLSYVEWPEPTDDDLSPAMRVARCVDEHSSLNGVRDSHCRRAGAARFIGIACVASAVFAGMQAYTLKQQTDDADAQVRARQERGAEPASVAPAPWSRSELARVRAVNAAVRELNLPIAPMLRALMPPRDIRVTLLSIGVESATHSPGSLTVSAAAPSGEEMARYVGFLTQRSPLLHAYLVRHEVDSADPAQPYRFDVEVSWRH